jgi:hypothetical protein
MKVANLTGFTVLDLHNLPPILNGLPETGEGSTPPLKIRNFDKAEPNSEFRGKYVTTK